MPSPRNVFSSLSSGAKRGDVHPLLNQIKYFFFYYSYLKAPPLPKQNGAEILLESQRNKFHPV